MNILHTIGTPGVGGVQVYLLDLSKYDKQYGISRNLLCLYGNDGEYKKKFKENGVNCFSCTIMPQDHGLRPYRFWKKIRKILKPLFFVKFFKAIRILKPDIIVCEEPSNLNTQLLVSRLLRIPFIWYLGNENQFLHVNKTIFDWLFEYFLKNNLYIISDSKFTLKKNLGPFRKKMNNHWHQIPILPQTISLKSMLNEKTQEKYFFGSRIHLGSIGRLVWQKDYKLLIRVFEKLRKKSNAEVFLSIAGDGPLQGKLTELIQKLGLKKYVKLVGNVERSNIPAFLSSLDIYVQSSVSEGSPVTIKEAMAASLPIVSTNSGGIPEMIIDGETGILVPNADEDKFVNSIIKIINMKSSDRKIIGKNARNYAMTNLSISLLAKKQFELYSRIISQNCLRKNCYRKPHEF